MQITKEQLQQIIKEEIEAVLSEKEGKKDACYHKVKARYDVWPSAYASGALSKCRKVGAKNWGNKSKKDEGLDLDEGSYQTGVYSVEDSELKTAENMMNMYKKHGFNKQAEAIQKAIEKGKAKEISSKEFMRLLDAANKMEEQKKKEAGTESSKENNLRDWFGRKGAKGSKGGWVDCNSPDGKGGYKSCGRSDGEKRSKYPSCRPTPGACKEKGKGKSWGKKAAKGKK